MIAIACDHGGLALKQAMTALLAERGTRILDLGTATAASVDYPDFAHRLAHAVASRKARAGILICGTGIGMSMAANRHRGVRAAVCTNEYMARMARLHNDANVLCLGERVVGADLARAIASVFLETGFEGGRHRRRVRKIEL